jgi:hypothetical protein
MSSLRIGIVDSDRVVKHVDRRSKTSILVLRV